MLPHLPEFSDSLNAFRSSQDSSLKIDQALAEARRRLHNIETQLAALRRYSADDRLDHRRASLEEERGSLQQSLRRLQESRKVAQASLVERFVDFGRFTDPTQNISRLSDEYPILLFPVRLETRFKTIAGEGSPASQLWVRVYPDDCLVDSFESTLSESELDGAQDYWSEIWASGDMPDGRRGAWRALVRSFGSGRSAWIVRNTTVLNPDEKPTEVQPGEIILVIPSTGHPTGEQMTELETYWKAYWRAEGDRAAQIAAYEAFAVAVSPGIPAEEVEAFLERYRPFNLTTAPTPPHTRADTLLSFAWPLFEARDPLNAKLASWTEPPRAPLLPDRFVLLAYNLDDQGRPAPSPELVAIGAPVLTPLDVGPDPSAPAESQFQITDGDLKVSDAMRWMVDFDRAVEVGMGFKVDLTPEQAARGFDRLIVLGVRIDPDPTANQKELESLLEHHLYSRKGLGIVRQGTPTNNTEDQPSGLQGDDPDASFDDFFQPNDWLAAPEDWDGKRDGQWLAELLGVRLEVLQDIPNSSSSDVREARCMNLALWSATLGYSLDALLNIAGEKNGRETDIIDDAGLERARWFFTRFVTARGFLPVVRVGRQPYGLLPVTAFSRLRRHLDDRLQPLPGWDFPEGYFGFHSRLYTALTKIDADWTTLRSSPGFVGKSDSDPHQLLLDILGLQPTSVEYYQRYADSAASIRNQLAFFGRLADDIVAGLQERALNLLRSFGYAGEGKPEILDIFFRRKPNRLNGPLIDDLPLSETTPIRAYTPAPDAKNYIGWLIDAVQKSLNTLQAQEGFIEDQPPRALLYLLMRHALINSFREVALRLYLSADVISRVQFNQARVEPKFVHLEGKNQFSESRLAILYRPEPRVTNNAEMAVGDYIPTVIGKALEARHLDESLRALECLRDVPTARLERLLAEHVDLCSYRLDAWKQGFVNQQLLAMRYRSSRVIEGDETSNVEVRPGLFLGAYGWLENLRPEGKRMEEVTLEEDLRAVFQREGDPPLLFDPTNFGHIHAPSLQQAVTAAVLRNGFLSNATPANHKTLSVNLSSERVRRALGLLEGIRSGQSLGALLGYHFERGLHDRYTMAEVDEFIYDLRRAFPIPIDPKAGGPQSGDVNQPSLESIQTRNVIDGLKLVEHVRSTDNPHYPFDKTLPEATDQQREAIDAEVQRLLDLHDSVADLAIAEAVHQVLQGNYDRAAAALDAFGKAGFPPEPQVIETPRSGLTLTHRVGVHLVPASPPTPGSSIPPRRLAEPTLDSWVDRLFPDLASVSCRVDYFDASQGHIVEDSVTLAQLGLAPIDLLYTPIPDGSSAQTLLDDLIVRRILETRPARIDSPMVIRYTTPAATTFTVFQLAALLSNLRGLVLRSRPLRPSDLLLQGEAFPKADASPRLDAGRVAALLPLLGGLQTSLETFAAQLQSRLDALPAGLPQVISSLDASVRTFAGLAAAVSRYGHPQTGFGFAYEARRAAAARLLEQIRALVDRWQARLTRFQEAMDAYEALPIEATAEERFQLLQRAEIEVSTSLTPVTSADPEDLKTTVLAKRAQFVSRRQDFAGLLDTHHTTFSSLHSGAAALLPVDAFEHEGFDLDAAVQAAVDLTRDLSARAAALAAQIAERQLQAQAKLDEHAAATDPAARLRLLGDAAHLLLSDDFLLLPEYDLDTLQKAELQSAWNDRASLLSHVTGQGAEFPVEDWLHGVARVREKVRRWENLVLLAPAFGQPEPELVPFQLPYQPSDAWLAMPFPDTVALSGERLLYTAHHDQGFNPARPLCGLLLDEWTEVIPVKDETTGLAFHYDRPNSEPPQVWLLVTPTAFRGQWDWADLVDALHETLEMAKRRAIEPVHIETTPYGHFLPATVSAVASYPVTIAMNLALNNDVLKFIRE